MKNNQGNSDVTLRSARPVVDKLSDAVSVLCRLSPEEAVFLAAQLRDRRAKEPARPRFQKQARIAEFEIHIVEPINDN